MDQLISLIPPSAYEELEKYLKRTLRRISDRVDGQRQSEIFRREHQKKLAALAFHAKRLQSLPDDEAVAAMMSIPPFPCGSVALHYLTRARRDHVKALRRQRDRRIATLVDKGHTNAEIARRVGLSPSTVAKIAAQHSKGDLP